MTGLKTEEKQNKKRKLYDVEAKWAFRSIATALLQGNVHGYCENPRAWIEDANAMTRRLLMASEIFARTEGEQDA